MKTAQRMVDEAAREAGYRTTSRIENRPIKVLHGTTKKFTVFSNKAKTVHGQYFGKGFYFTDSEDAAKYFAEENIRYYNPQTGDFDLKKESYIKGVYLDMGNIINVAVHINKTGQYNRVFFDANKLATVFGREKFYSYVRRQVEEGNLTKIKKRGVQASERTALIAGGYDENAFKKNIPQPELEIKNSLLGSDNPSIGTTVKYQVRSASVEQIEKENYDHWKSIEPATRLQSTHLDLTDDRNVARYRLEIDDVMRNKNRTNVMVGMPNEYFLDMAFRMSLSI